MPDLDSPHEYTPAGVSRMLQHLRDFPSECERAWNNAGRLEMPSGYEAPARIVICGMGGSAIGGDLARRLALKTNKVPIWIHRDYGPPPVSDESTLLIFSSYSGNTEETLSCFTESRGTPAKKLAITTGGKLGEMASGEKIPTFRIDYPAPPRAAFPHSFMPLLRVFDRLGLLEMGPHDVQEALTSLSDLASRIGEEVPLTRNTAKQTAQRLDGKLGVIYGAGLLTEVAKRWKTQLNENSKSWSFSEVFPELNHNAVVGFELPQGISKRAHVILLHSSAIPERISLRYRLTAELLSRYSVSHELIEAPGKSPLSQILTLVLLGDWASFYLAVLNGVDPITVAPIDFLKSRLTD